MNKKVVYVLLVCLLCAGCSKESLQQLNLASAVNETKEENVQAQAEEAMAVTRDIFAMDTYMTVTAYGDNAEEAVSEAQERIEQLDAMLSTGFAESEVSLLNKNGRGTLSADVFYLLKQSMDICQRTDGTFNPAIYPLMEAWGFPEKKYEIPEDETIQKCLSLIDVKCILCDSSASSVEFGIDGMKIDFGGIAKGYTSSQIVDIFQKNGIESGVISLGGNVQVLGSKTDGSFWRIAIQDPDEKTGYLGVLEIKDKAVITSGGYERYFEEDGVIYHHILDPSTGYPAKSGLKSVTIVSEDGLLADGLSTALFVMGLEKAENFWRKNSGEFDTILLTEENELYVTEGIVDAFSTEYEMHVIKKETQ